MERVAGQSLFDALEFAVDAHARVGHLRKGTRFPYVIHPIRVACDSERPLFVTLAREVEEVFGTRC